MAKYRKKPVVIEAVQYPCEHRALRRCTCAEFNKGNPRSGAGCSNCGRVYIQTLEGAMTVSPGDWIITGVQGEHYPCKPDIFAATYEPADELGEPHVRQLLNNADSEADLAGTPRPSA